MVSGISANDQTPNPAFHFEAGLEAKSSSSLKSYALRKFDDYKRPGEGAVGRDYES
jgi:hypothetical protein